MQLDRLLAVLREPVDADDHALAGLDLGLVAEGRLLDLTLDEPLLDRLDRATQLVDPFDQLARTLLQLVRHRLDEVGAAERIGGVRPAGLGGEDLLRPQRDPRRPLGRQRKRLVERIRVDRLRPAAYGRERLDGHADDVVLGLLRGQRRAAGLRVEAKRLRLRIGGAEAVAHDSGPHPPGGAELGHLLEEVVVRIEEEGEARAELVRRQPRVDGGLRVRDPVCQREGELLCRRRARLADVVPGDRDRVDQRQPLVQYANRSVVIRIDGRGGKM